MDYETFFKLSPDLMGIVGPDKHFKELNPAWEKVMGYSIPELKSRPAMEFVHPDDRERTLQTNRTLTADGHLHHFENRLVARDGTAVWFSWSVSSPPAGEQGLLYFVAKVITRRKLAEAELEKNQSLIEAFLENLPSASYARDIEGRYIFVNKGYELLMGVDRIAHLGKKPHEVFSKENADLFWSVQQEVQKTGAPRTGNSEIPIGNESRYFSHVLFPLRNRSGEITGVGGVSTDITEKKRNSEQLRFASEELLAQKTFLRDVLSSLPYAAFWKDRNSVYLGCNERFLHDAGLRSTADIVGKTDFDMPWKKEEAEYYRKCDREVMDRNQPLLNLEETQLNAEGQEIVLMTSKVPFHDSTGKVIGMLGVYSNITQIRADQRQLAEQQAKLIAASKMSSLGEMASGIAHELNNPLAIIHGKASQLRKKIQEESVSPPTIIRDLEKIEMTTMRISKIIRGLHIFSHSAGDDPFTDVPIAAIVEDTLELCQERFLKGSVQLVIKPLPDIKVECRPVQISQVLLSLLNNAFDAVCTHSEKVVELEVQEVGARLRLAVTDSGPGIPKVIVDKLMQPFFTTKELGKGAGLGLSIAKGLVEDHRGILVLNSTSPKTQFIVEIPLTRADSRTKNDRKH